MEVGDVSQRGDFLFMWDIPPITSKLQRSRFSFYSPKFKMKGTEYYFNFSKAEEGSEILSFALRRNGRTAETVILAYRFCATWEGFTLSKKLVDTFDMDKNVGADFNIHEFDTGRRLEKMNSLADGLQLRCMLELYCGGGVYYSSFVDKYFQKRYGRTYTSKMPIPNNHSAELNHSTVLQTLDSAEVVSSEIFKQPIITSSVSEIAKPDDVKELVKVLNVISLSGHGCDVTLKVKDREFRAHKAILTSRSPVFFCMFQSSMMDDKSDVFDIDDCEPDIFSAFLLYLYTGSLEIFTIDNVIDLFRIAGDFCVQGMTAACERFVQSNLTVNRFCEFYRLASMPSTLPLLDIAGTFFSKNLKDIIVTSEWGYYITDYPRDANELFINALAK